MDWAHGWAGWHVSDVMTLTKPSDKVAEADISRILHTI